MAGRNGIGRIIKAVAALAILAALSVAAYTTVDAQGPGRRGDGPPFGGPMGGRGRMGGPGGPGGPGILGELRALDLTEAQQTQVREIMVQHREGTRQLHEKGMTARKALRDAIESDTIDDAAIRARSAAVGTIDAEQAVAEAHLRQSVRQVLTAEQLQKARELRERREARFENRQQARHDRVLRLRGRIRERIDALR